MAKKLLRRSPKNSTLVILGTSLICGICYTIWNSYLRPQSIDVMEVSSPIMIPGNTTLSGIIKQKDNNFYLLLDDGNLVQLLVSEIEHLQSQHVLVEGFLFPPEGSTMGSITVDKIVIETLQ